VRLRAIELIRVELPLVAPFRTAHGVTDRRDVLVVRVCTDDADGWAECVAPVDPTYTSEFVESATLVLANYLVPAVLAKVAGPVTAAAPVTLKIAIAAMETVRGHAMARAALETAMLDACLREEGISLAQHLGATRSRVPAGVAVGAAGNLEDLLDEVDARVAEGYTRVKLKVMPGWDVEPLAVVRDRHPKVMLAADANGSYAHIAKDAARNALSALDRFDLACLEQPLGERDLVGHAQLAQQIATPICLDETITCYDDLAAALALGACSVVNLKVGRVGGIREAKRIHDRCYADGVGLWCGGMLETGLGRAVNLAFAALPGMTQPGDLSASRRYFTADLTEAFELDAGGCLTVPTGPGLGVVPLQEALAHRTFSTLLRA
jgi:o-succinylbenzoate synthase